LDREKQSRIREAIDAMEPATRAILVLRYMEELSISQVASVLEVPEGTARSRLYYARIELCRRLRPYLMSASHRTGTKES
jgi:RNA polymerase sigma-70 factor (ECF subfamily)